MILNGVMDPKTTAHGPNESMHLGIFRKASARMYRAGFAPGSYELVKGFANQLKSRYLLGSLEIALESAANRVSASCFMPC